MSDSTTLQVHSRSRTLVRDDNDRLVWRIQDTASPLPTSQTALVLCDVWDRHWCRGANERLQSMLPCMNEVVATLRERGVLIVHAPSETMQFYEGTPARQRALDAPSSSPPAPLDHEDPPLPVDTRNDNGCDTPPDQPYKAWKSQHPAIDIDQSRDVISDNGNELYNVYSQRGIKNVLIMGVHTNMCVLHRSFSIKAMVRWGFQILLVRDLTDAMYSPASSPYVSHEEGTKLVIEYIEKYWCPSVSSDDLLASNQVGY